MRPTQKYNQTPTERPPPAPDIAPYFICENLFCKTESFESEISNLPPVEKLHAAHTEIQSNPDRMPADIAPCFICENLFCKTGSFESEVSNIPPVEKLHAAHTEIQTLIVRPRYSAALPHSAPMSVCEQEFYIVQCFDLPPRSRYNATNCGEQWRYVGVWLRTFRLIQAIEQNCSTVLFEPVCHSDFEIKRGGAPASSFHAVLPWVLFKLFPFHFFLNFLSHFISFLPHLSSGSCEAVSHQPLLGGPQPQTSLVWDLWWTLWQRDRFSSNT
jgi:hypothetical protein